MSAMKPEVARECQLELSQKHLDAGVQGQQNSKTLQQGLKFETELSLNATVMEFALTLEIATDC